MLDEKVTELLQTMKVLAKATQTTQDTIDNTLARRKNSIESVYQKMGLTTEDGAYDRKIIVTADKGKQTRKGSFLYASSLWEAVQGAPWWGRTRLYIDGIFNLAGVVLPPGVWKIEGITPAAELYLASRGERLMETHEMGITQVNIANITLNLTHGSSRSSNYLLKGRGVTSLDLHNCNLIIRNLTSYGVLDPQKGYRLVTARCKTNGEEGNRVWSWVRGNKNNTRSRAHRNQI